MSSNLTQQVGGILAKSINEVEGACRPNFPVDLYRMGQSILSLATAVGAITKSVAMIEERLEPATAAAEVGPAKLKWLPTELMKWRYSPDEIAIVNEAGLIVADFGVSDFRNEDDAIHGQLMAIAPRLLESLKQFHKAVGDADHDISHDILQAYWDATGVIDEAEGRKP